MKRWIRYFYLIFIILIIIAFITQYNEIKNVFYLVLKANIKLLILPILLIGFGFLMISMTYKKLLKSIGYDVSLFKFFKLSIVMTSLNSLIPSMGLAGHTAIFHSLKNHYNVEDGKIISTITIYTIALLFSFMSIFFLSLIWFLITVKLNILDFMMIFFVVLFLVIIYWAYSLLKNKKKLLSILIKIKNFINKISHTKFTDNPIKELLQEFYDGSAVMTKNRKLFLMPFMLMLLKNIGDILSIYFIFLSLGVSPNLFVIIFGIAAGVVLSVITFIPGGIGIFEVGMTGAFIALGLPLQASIATVLIFRIISFWIPVLMGISIYKHTLKI